jgi:hypothetical protein
MSLAVQEAPETAPSHGGTGNRELNHVACCKDRDIALCATDTTGHSWAPRNAEITCVVCADLLTRPCVQVCPLRSKEAS